MPTGVMAFAKVVGLSGSARKPSLIACLRSLSRLCFSYGYDRGPQVTICSIQSVGAGDSYTYHLIQVVHLLVVEWKIRKRRIAPARVPGIRNLACVTLKSHIERGRISPCFVTYVALIRRALELRLKFIAPRRCWRWLSATPRYRSRRCPPRASCLVPRSLCSRPLCRLPSPYTASSSPRAKTCTRWPTASTVVAGPWTEGC